MKIDEKFINDIFNRKIELKSKEDKIKLSKYSDIIPMYDIYSDSIYPIHNTKIHYKLKDCHFRFTTSEVYDWIKLKMEKKSITKDDLDRYKKNIKILNNYDLDTLEKTSYETLYKYSPDFGLSISICKRNSFHPLANHLLPYYSRNELIKLGMNNKIISNITPEKLVDKKLHYKICVKVSDNDISNKYIQKQMKKIIENNCVNWVVYYSLTGSYLFNDYLRNNNKISNYLVDGVNKLVDTINSADKLNNDFYFYRFLWDDKFLQKLKVGDIFTDKGLMSTTRDPFYSPGIDGDFGLILLKINIPKNENPGLMMEMFSMFPKEEEYLLKPNSKFKLTSKDDNFKYYHVNEEFEKKIKKKYEFTYIGSDDKIYKGITDKRIPEINLDSLKIVSSDKLKICESFLEMCDDNGNFVYNKDIYMAQWVDSSETYSKFYSNKSKDNFTITLYDDGYPKFIIEIGRKLSVNYIRKYHYYNKDQNINDIENFNHIISMIAKIFNYNKAYIHFPYKNFSQFEKNYNTNKVYLYNHMYNYPIYEYLKNNKKIYENDFYKFSYRDLDKFKKTEYNGKTWGDYFINVVENEFYNYNKMEEIINNKFNNLMNKYVEFDIVEYLRSKNVKVVEKPDLDKFKFIDKGPRFKLIYNDTIKR